MIGQVPVRRSRPHPSSLAFGSLRASLASSLALLLGGCDFVVFSDDASFDLESIALIEKTGERTTLDARALPGVSMVMSSKIEIFLQGSYRFEGKLTITETDPFSGLTDSFEQKFAEMGEWEEVDGPKQVVRLKAADGTVSTMSVEDEDGKRTKMVQPMAKLGRFDPPFDFLNEMSMELVLLRR